MHCDTCRHWHGLSDAWERRMCVILTALNHSAHRDKTVPVAVEGPPPVEIRTRPEFGCTTWDAVPGTPGFPAT